MDRALWHGWAHFAVASVGWLLLARALARFRAMRSGTEGVHVPPSPDLPVALGAGLAADGPGLGAGASGPERWHQIVVGLTAADPASVEWQHRLLASWNQISGLRRDRGDLAAAAAAFAAASGVAQRMAMSDPGRIWWNAGLLTNSLSLGDVQIDRGDLDGAERAFDDAERVARHLTMEDPHNAHWQNDLAASRSRLGSICHLPGDLNGTLQRHCWPTSCSSGWRRRTSATRSPNSTQR